MGSVKKKTRPIAFRQHAMKRRRKKYMIAGSIVGVLLFGLIITYLCCGVKTVLVEGNEKYSDEKVKELVLTSAGDYNTMYQFFKIQFAGMPKIVFFDMVDVEIVSYDTLLIHVYEKQMVGCVEQNGNYICFDRDGIVVEISAVPKEDVPFVEGLSFEEAKLYQELQVTDAKVFNTLVTLSQLLEKKSLQPDRICFMTDQTIELAFGEVLVKLGEDAYLDNKISRLGSIMETLTGRSGILDMSKVTESTKKISFLKTLSEAEKQAQAEAEAEAQAEAETWIPEEDWSSEEEESEEWSSQEDTSDEQWTGGDEERWEEE